ncbi:26259_t:CDS:1 [Dentiscutata erythropus]|uniref:26259_t:CDS:1 n=1 Tax=Dentiscutata erythropus TaxID=1348616 RepID=A0A9N9IJR9_9GLOM|nr:26259_t:CDS:1 [Dentiscutata erythropus]
MRVCKKDDNKKENDDNDKRSIMVCSMSLGEIFRDEVKLNNLPETNGEINSIEDVGSKDDLKMKMVIGNDVINNVKTVEQAMNRIIMIKPTIVNNGMTLRRGISYAKLIRYDHEAKSGGNRLKAQKSCSNVNSEWILNLLDQVRKRRFYDCIYLNYMIGCDGVKHAIFGNRIDMCLGLKH